MTKVNAVLACDITIDYLKVDFKKGEQILLDIENNIGFLRGVHFDLFPGEYRLYN